MQGKMPILENSMKDVSAPEPLVAMQNISVTRGGKTLVQGVNLTIGRGQIVTLIGPNGSGKSTTAKVATGVLAPSEGQVVRQPGLKIGYVPQKLVIDWTLPLTVERLMCLTGKYSSQDINETLEIVGVKHLAKAAVQNLSGGEFQRVLMARAIIRKPDLLVLDEPVQGVDFAGEMALYDLILRIRDTTQCGILMISHDLHVVMAQTDIVVCLNGHVCCTGSPEAVAESPEYMQLFGGRAANTLAIYHHDHDHEHLPDGRVRHADGSIHAHEAHEHDAHGHSSKEHADHNH